MMKKSLYILTTIILMIASFIYGARFGAEIFITSNAKFQAGLATANLIRLDQLEDLYVKKYVIKSGNLYSGGRLI